MFQWHTAPPTMSSTRTIQYSAEALVMHRSPVRRGRYCFPDPKYHDREVSLDLGDPGGIDVQFGNKAPIQKASPENLVLSTHYLVECQIELNKELQLHPDKGPKKLDWPRTSSGRRHLEDIFLSNINYFHANLLYLAGRRRTHGNSLIALRPLGSADIINISFHLDGQLVAAQGNHVLADIMFRFKKKPNWPRNRGVAEKFQSIPVESLLLSRAVCLINLGFYQEAVLVAFSVLDAKVQELVEFKMSHAFGFDKNKTKKYLRNITSERLDTSLNFLLKCIDHDSLRDRYPDLSSQLSKVNSKRNRIVHDGEAASREEGCEAVSVIAQMLNALNCTHGSKFDVPNYLSDPSLRHWVI